MFRRNGGFAAAPRQSRVEDQTKRPGVRAMNQSEERLSSALRELASYSKQCASAELGMALKDAFRRHHAQRRRAVRIRVTLLCACVAALAGSLLFRKPT